MAKILLLYASSYGQTAKIAERLATRWRARGHAVDCLPLGTRAEPSPDGFDAVVLGSRLAVTYARSLERYVRLHRDALAATRSGFFSVSMSAASADPVDGAIRAKIGALLHDVRWSPEHVASFAGALPYSKYDPVTRAVMKFISARAGHPTDTSRDYEFTDWAKVDDFADDVSEQLSIARDAPPESSARSVAASG